MTGPQRDEAVDVIDGQKLALAQAGGRAGRFPVTFEVLDEGARDPADVESATALASRDAIADRLAVAVIGSLDSRSAMISVPLLNAAGLLQVSPSGGYRGLTEPTEVRGEPGRFYPSGTESFARVAGDDRAMARAMVEAAGDARVVAVEEEPGEVSAALAADLRRTARRQGIRLTQDPGRADAVLFAGADAGTVGAIAEDARRVVVGEDAARRLSPEQAANRRIRAVVRTARRDAGWAAEFRERFGREPTTWAALGHEAMVRVLAAIDRAGEQGTNRRRVMREYFAAGHEPAGFTVAPARP